MRSEFDQKSYIVRLCWVQKNGISLPYRKKETERKKNIYYYIIIYCKLWKECCVCVGYLSRKESLHSPSCTCSPTNFLLSTYIQIYYEWQWSKKTCGSENGAFTPYLHCDNDDKPLGFAWFCHISHDFPEKLELLKLFPWFSHVFSP